VSELCYRGKPISEMTKAELIETCQALHAYYEERIEQLNSDLQKLKEFRRK